MSSTRILGIDPGSRVTGWALVTQQGRTLTAEDSGTVRLSPQADLSQRLGRLQEELERIMDRLHPSTVAVEDVFSHRNARSALALGQARGVALAVAGRRQLSVFAYPPATVKRAVCGHGRADKQQVQAMVRVLLSRPEKMALDESDALAIAICHALCHRAGGL